MDQISNWINISVVITAVCCLIVAFQAVNLTSIAANAKSKYESSLDGDYAIVRSLIDMRLILERNSTIEKSFHDLLQLEILIVEKWDKFISTYLGGRFPNRSTLDLDLLVYSTHENLNGDQTLSRQIYIWYNIEIYLTVAKIYDRTQDIYIHKQASQSRERDAQDILAEMREALYYLSRPDILELERIKEISANNILSIIESELADMQFLENSKQVLVLLYFRKVVSNDLTGRWEPVSIPFYP